jgi:hypothetical protein
LIIIVAHWPFEGSSFWGVREIRKDRKKQIWMKDIKKPKKTFDGTKIREYV